MRLWAGEDGMLSDMAMYLFVFYFYLRSISEISILVRNTSGIWWEGKWIAVVETLLNLILNIILVNIWGIEGVILATIISMILINIPFETYTVYKTCFKISPMKDLINYVFQGFLMVIIVVLTYNVADLIHCDGFKEIILKGLVSVIVSNCMLLLIYIKNSKLKALLIILLQGLHLK
jgi:O-antigen/teichoic acid export membrane protein